MDDDANYKRVRKDECPRVLQDLKNIAQRCSCTVIRQTPSDIHPRLRPDTHEMPSSFLRTIRQRSDNPKCENCCIHLMRRTGVMRFTQHALDLMSLLFRANYTHSLCHHICSAPARAHPMSNASLAVYSDEKDCSRAFFCSRRRHAHEETNHAKSQITFTHEENALTDHTRTECTGMKHITHDENAQE